MLEDLIFSLNRVSPYFLLILLGAALRRVGLASRGFFLEANSFTFRIALPAQLFCSIVGMEHPGLGEARFVLCILGVTLVSFIVIWLVTELLFKDKAIIGTLVQGAFRSNYILLGLPLAGAVLGPSAIQTAAIASIVIIPAYNILAVIALCVRSNTGRLPTVRELVCGIVFNPLIIGICVAMPLMLLNFKMPMFMDTTLNYVGQTGTPLGLLSIGGLLSLKDATARLRPALYASSIKILFLPAAVMAASIALGFRDEELLALFVMAASPVAISSYAMAAQMDGDLPLASNIMIISTLLSGFSLALGIYFLRTFAFI